MLELHQMDKMNVNMQGAVIGGSSHLESIRLPPSVTRVGAPTREELSERNVATTKDHLKTLQICLKGDLMSSSQPPLYSTNQSNMWI